MNLKFAAVVVALAFLPAIASGKPPFQESIDDKPQIRFISLANVVLDGTAPDFQIRVFCEKSFNLKTVYATVRDATTSVDVTFDGVRLQGPVFGTDVAPPTAWFVAHQDLTVEVGTESFGYELLSNMEIPALGVGAGGSFDILGTRSPNTGATVMTIGAVVESSGAPDNSCEVIIRDLDA